MENPKTWLINHFSKTSQSSDFSADANYFEIGLIDSLQVIELIEDLEQYFKISFNEVDFQDRRFVTINGLSSIIEEKLEELN